MASGFEIKDDAWYSRSLHPESFGIPRPPNRVGSAKRFRLVLFRGALPMRAGISVVLISSSRGINRVDTSGVVLHR